MSLPPTPPPPLILSVGPRPAGTLVPVHARERRIWPEPRTNTKGAVDRGLIPPFLTGGCLGDTGGRSRTIRNLPATSPPTHRPTKPANCNPRLSAICKPPSARALASLAAAPVSLANGQPVPADGQALTADDRAPPEPAPLHARPRAWKLLSGTLSPHSPSVCLRLSLPPSLASSHPLSHLPGSGEVTCSQRRDRRWGGMLVADEGPGATGKAV